MRETTGHGRFGGAGSSHGPRRQGARAAAPRMPCRTGLRRQVRRAAGRDRNPLCRPYDRARSVIVLVAAALLAAALAGAWAVAAMVAGGEGTAMVQQQAHRHLVSAVTTSAAIPDTAYGAAEAQAVWTYPGASSHTAWITVPYGTRADSPVTTWVDDSGNPAPQPSTDSTIAADAALTALGTVIVETGVVLAAAALAGRLVDRRAARAWDAEWSRIEPGWSGRTSSA